MTLPLVFYAIAAWSRRWMSDDGYIYLRVVRQLLDGNGPVYNHGERVEAATSPLWVGLLAGAKGVFRPVDLPWLAVVLGLALSIAGLALAQWGAHRLWSRGRGVIVPFGALVVVALPPFWDFATSGLETGLSFAWLGACFWALAREVTNGGEQDRAKALSLHAAASPTPLPLRGRGAGGEGEAEPPLWLPILIGLGPLIRPDFALYSIAFLAALLLMRRSMTLRARTQAVALAIALPFAYEVFRMGYYAALVPNPAFAKEASTPRVAQGWYYLLDTLRTYWLFVPALLITVAIALWLATRPWRTQRAATVLIAATIAGALAHGAYGVYVGGDFMHARMLLPAIFALLMPFAVSEIDRPRALVPAFGVIVWAIACAALLRPGYDGIGPHGIANERAYYVSLAHNAHPITLRDYAQYEGEALALIREAELKPDHLLLASGDDQLPLRSDVAAKAAVFSSSIGIYGYVFDDDVYVVDLHGLAEPIAGRLELASRGRPGHEKLLPLTWVVARFADPTALVPADIVAGDIAAAREALSCGDLRRLLGATSDPITPGRFAHNIIDAFRLHRVRIPPDPLDAQRKFC